MAARRRRLADDKNLYARVPDENRQIWRLFVDQTKAPQDDFLTLDLNVLQKVHKEIHVSLPYTNEETCFPDPGWKKASGTLDGEKLITLVPV